MRENEMTVREYLISKGFEVLTYEFTEDDSQVFCELRSQKPDTWDVLSVLFDILRVHFKRNVMFVAFKETEVISHIAEMKQRKEETE